MSTEKGNRIRWHLVPEIPSLGGVCEWCVFVLHQNVYTGQWVGHLVDDVGRQSLDREFPLLRDAMENCEAIAEGYYLDALASSDDR